MLQKCFESRDIGSLQAAIGEMPEDEAKYHMKRCVDSGLWVPEGGKVAEGKASETNAPSTSATDSKTTTAATPTTSTEDVD